MHGRPPQNAQKEEEKRLYQRNAFAEDLRQASINQRNLEFKNLDMTEQAFQELRKKAMTAEELAQAEILEKTTGLVAGANVTKEIFPPGLYATDPPSNYHINYEDGKAKILFKKRMWKEVLFDSMDYEETAKAYGDLIDFIVRANKCDGVEIDFPNGIDQRTLLIMMQGCQDRGVSCYFSEKTKEHMQDWSPKEREVWYQYMRDINTHAKKCQMLVDIDGKSIQEYANDINKLPKLTLAKADGTLKTEDELKAELFKNYSTDTSSAQHLADLDKTLDDIKTRITGLEDKKSALEMKLTSMEGVLENPNFLETTIRVPKNWGETHDDVMGDAFKNPTDLYKVAKALVTIPTYVLPVIGAIPHFLYMKFADRTREAKAGSLDPGGVVSKLEDNWLANKAEVEALITAVNDEVADLTKRQELVQKEIARLNSAEIELLNFAGTPQEKQALDDKIATLKSEIEALDEQLGEQDPIKRAELEAALKEAEGYEEQRKINQDESIVNDSNLEKAEKRLGKLENKLDPVVQAQIDEYAALKEKAKVGDGLTDPAALARLSELSQLEDKFSEQIEVKEGIKEAKNAIQKLESKKEKLDAEKAKLMVQDPNDLNPKLTSVTEQVKEASASLSEMQATRAEYITLQAKAKTLEGGLSDPAELVKLTELKAKVVGIDDKIEQAQQKVAQLTAQKTNLEKDKVKLRDPVEIKTKLGLTGEKRTKTEVALKEKSRQLNAGVTDPTKQKELAQKVKDLKAKDESLKKEVEKSKASAKSMKEKMEKMAEKIKEARNKVDSTMKLDRR